MSQTYTLSLNWFVSLKALTMKTVRPIQMQNKLAQSPREIKFNQKYVVKEQFQQQKLSIA